MKRWLIRVRDWLFPNRNSHPRAIHPWRWRLLALWIVIFTIVAFWGIRTNRDLGRDGRQAHDAICVLKDDFKRRIADSERFLNEHPNGIPGITAQAISESLEGLRRTLQSLGAVRCEGATKN
jgi:hypothetical protein